MTRGTRNDAKRRKRESSLILRGPYSTYPLPNVVVFDKGRRMVCEMWSRRIGGMCMVKENNKII